MPSTSDLKNEPKAIAEREERDRQLIYFITDRLNCLVHHLKSPSGAIYAVCLMPDCKYYEMCRAILNSTPEFRAIRGKLAEE